MSEDSDPGEVSFDSAAFEEWVEKTAESKGISRGEVLDQMLSSYWILEELTGMMGETDQGGPASRLRGGTSSEGPESDSPDADASGNGVGTSRVESDRPGENETSELIREFQQLRSAILELSERPEAREGEPPSNPREDDPQSPSSHGKTDDRLRRTLSDLQDRVEELSEELSEVKDEHDRDVADLQAEIEKTLDTLGSLESLIDDRVGHSELESLAVSLEQELSRIEETTGDLDGRVTQLEEVHSETAAEVAALADSHSEFEARLDREFDSIEDLFEHLLDRTDDLEHRLGAIPDARDAELESVEDAVAEREQLTGIMREAHRKGISRAVCTSCETKVDLGLLQEPYCPGCDRSVSGLERGGWLPFDRPSLKTEPIQNAPDAIGEGTPDPSDLLESPPEDDPRT